MHLRCGEIFNNVSLRVY